MMSRFNNSIPIILASILSLGLIIWPSYANADIPDHWTFDMGYVGTNYAVGGPMKLYVDNRGDYTFFSGGNWHDSGSDNYHLGLSIYLTTRSGLAYQFPVAVGNVDGHCAGLSDINTPFGSVNLGGICGSEGSHDFSWTMSGNNAQIAQNWNDPNKSVLVSRPHTYVNVDSSLEKTAAQVEQDVGQALAKAGWTVLVM